MKKVLLVSMLLIGLMAPAAHAQEPYKAALGARLGNYLGLTFKYNFNEKSALEILGETRRKSAFLTGLYEYHIGFNAVDGLRLYLGGGAHVGYANVYFINDVTGTRHSTVIGGLDLIAGLEYTFERAPINLSFDYKPGMYYWDKVRFTDNNFALSIRYCFGQ